MVDVTNGAEALDTLAARAFDIVLMDRHMPEMNGLEATRRIRQLQGPLSQIPIVGITASAIETEISACLKAGMDEVLTKPVIRKLLLGALERLSALDGKTPAALARESVLVVDIVEVDRVVIEKQLAKLGLACQFANDGEEALQTATEAVFCLILTDMSLPRMDDLSFVASLREQEKSTSSPTPVVAVTGQAEEPGDRDRYLEAGMADFLVKPIEFHRLAATLERLPKRLEQADAGVRLPQLDDDVLDLAPMLEAYGSIDDHAKEMFELYRTTTADYIERLRAAHARDDTEAAIDASHAAAGASKNAGAKKLGALFSQVEIALHAGDLGQAQGRMTEIDQAWARLEEALSKLPD